MREGDVMGRRKLYTVNEIFYSLQGEGLRAGTANVFVRFAGCNLQCDIGKSDISPGGFVCDTDFKDGKKMTAREIVDECSRLMKRSRSVIFTGGEPALQLDKDLLFEFKGWFKAIETNGTRALPPNIKLDWITLSPKVYPLALRFCDELKLVLPAGETPPDDELWKVSAEQAYLLSPVYHGNVIDPESLKWCIKMCKQNPEWRLSVQQHKFWGVR